MISWRHSKELRKFTLENRTKYSKGKKCIHVNLIKFKKNMKSS